VAEKDAKEAKEPYYLTNGMKTGMSEHTQIQDMIDCM
jgi:hypothetical protein